MFAVLAVVLYYGWPIIQTMIVLSPIPDPADLKRHADDAVRKVKDMFGGSEAVRPNPGAYSGNFDNAPDVVGGDSDEDEEDIGRNFNQQKDLNYDSDEKDEFGLQGADETELINLDQPEAKAPAKKNVPKLKKPGT